MAVAKIPGRVRVLISYSHDSDEHRRSVLALAQALRQFGVDAWIDQFEEANPPLNWLAWMHSQVQAADYVLLAATPKYKERAEGTTPPSEGRGVRWEGMLVTNELYNSDLVGTTRFIPVLLGDESSASIPYFLAQTNSYRLEDLSFGSLEPLLRRLTGQPLVVPDAIGEVPDLTPPQLPPVDPMSRRPADLGPRIGGSDPIVSGRPPAGPPSRPPEELGIPSGRPDNAPGSDAPSRAGPPAWQWPVGGPWVAFVVGDGVRLLQMAGRELVGSGPGDDRPRSRTSWPVPASQVTAAVNGTALISLGEGKLLMATVDRRGEVWLRPGSGPAPEDDLVLLGAFLQRDIVRIIGSSARGTLEFRIGTGLEPFGLRQLSDAASRAAVPLPGGSVRVDVGGGMSVVGDVQDQIRTLPHGGWKSLDQAGGEGASVFAGVRADAGGDWLHVVHQTAEGFRASALLLEEPAERVQVARTIQAGGQTAVLLQQGDTVVGWPAEDV